jgi:hypothetical protein
MATKVGHSLIFSFRERENHTTHLRSIEAELDAQVARVESQAREKARRDHEDEKRQLQEKMELEMAQLQSQLKIFQKVKVLHFSFCEAIFQLPSNRIIALQTPPISLSFTE